MIKRLVSALKSVLKSLKSPNCCSLIPCEIDDNIRNEQLEECLCCELEQNRTSNAAILIYENGELKFCPECNMVPVHFAKTDNGTFFWTRPIDEFQISCNYQSCYQQAEQQQY